MYSIPKGNCGCVNAKWSWFKLIQYSIPNCMITWVWGLLVAENGLLPRYWHVVSFPAIFGSSLNMYSPSHPTPHTLNNYSVHAPSLCGGDIFITFSYNYDMTRMYRTIAGLALSSIMSFLPHTVAVQPLTVLSKKGCKVIVQYSVSWWTGWYKCGHTTFINA